MLAPYILAILGDRVEMGHSIEARTPFLDHLVFEKVREVPDQLKIRDGVEKFVLREAFKEELTEELYNRKKWPYLYLLNKMVAKFIITE
jgi:asparagine synthase (glutamine-hydrolysing)